MLEDVRLVYRIIPVSNRKEPCYAFMLEAWHHRKLQRVLPCIQDTRGPFQQSGVLKDYISVVVIHLFHLGVSFPVASKAFGARGLLFRPDPKFLDLKILKIC